MAHRVEGKVAIVTGAGTGVGRASAVLLASEGAKVVVANRNADNGNETVRRIVEAGGEARYCQTDVAKPEDCARVVEETIAAYGRVDVLVNNAGIFPRASLEETTLEFWQTIMDINLRGPFLLCQAAIPHMIRQGGGSIINIGSINGLAGGARLFAYSTSKGGMLTMTRNLARAYARHQIRVNYIIPGWVITEGEIVVQAKEGHDMAWLEEMGRRQPMGRLQQPEDSAGAVLFLASDESQQVNACILNTDGGSSML